MLKDLNNEGKTTWVTHIKKMYGFEEVRICGGMVMKDYLLNYFYKALKIVFNKSGIVFYMI